MTISANIEYEEPSGAPAGFINVAGARNGLSVDSGSFIVLGEPLGSVTHPATLINDRQIPLGAQTLQIGITGDSTFSQVILQPFSTNVQDVGGNVIATIQPPNNVTIVGLPGQTLTAISVGQDIAYTGGSGSVQDFGSGSGWMQVSGPIQFNGFLFQAINSATGGSGDFTGFNSKGTILQGVGNTGKVRGFYHDPAIISINDPTHVAFENTIGDARLCTTTAGAHVGRVSIRVGTGVPSAFLHLGAGLAAAGNAPLKLTSGVLLTIPEAGAVEYDGVDFWGQATAGARLTFLRGLSGALAPATTATPVFTSFYGGNTIALGNPPNWLNLLVGGVSFKIPLYT
jgi:hypothetical protein